MKRFFNLLISNLLVSVSVFNIIGCSSNSDNNQWNQSYYQQLYENYFNHNESNPYHTFLDTASSKLEAPASAASQNEFNNLYQPGASTNIWNTFSALNTDLTTTVISKNVTTNVNWPSLYAQAGLSSIETQTAERHQLRFFNILAKIYKKSNILKLIQTAYFATPEQSNVVAYTLFYNQIASQIQVFGPNFVNQNLIDSQYQSGYWSTGDITTVSTHEYGHALSNFLASSPILRTNFNQIKVSDFSLLTNLKMPSVYDDRTQVLMDFLVNDAIKDGVIAFNDNIEKFLFDLLVSKSDYSHISFLTGDANQRDEYFAESFSYWMLTPPQKRDVAWQLLNDFFVNYAPSYYKI